MKICQHMYEVAEADLQKAVAEEEEEGKNLADKRDSCTTTKDKQGKDVGGDCRHAPPVCVALLCS